MWCSLLGSSGSCFPPPTHRQVLGAILDPQSMGSAVKDHMTRVHQSEAAPRLAPFCDLSLDCWGEGWQGRWGGRSDLMGFGLYLNEVIEFGSKLKVGKLGLPW